MRLFLRVAALGFVGFAVLAAELSLFGLQSKNLTVRQPRNGAPVQVVTKHQVLHQKMESAKRWAERLDVLSLHILSVSSLSTFERWRHNVDLTALKNQYSRDLLAHMESMAAVLKMRREAGGFKKLREFDFQTTIRKSDYILALPLTQECLERLLHDSGLSENTKKVVALYNQERVLYDHKVVTVAEN